ncbi:MAG: protein translocase subunit SecF [Vampirovibrio sp.]|nr:protein translocase subunit SecF [Vampirovibrio sp.]
MMMMTSPAETASNPSTPPVIKPANTTIKVDIVKHRFFNLGLSTLLLIPGLFFMVQTMVTTPNHTPIRLGIDFVGGTLLEYQFEKPLLAAQLPQLNQALATAGLQNPVVQLQQKISVPITNEKSGDLKLSPPKTTDNSAGTLVSIRAQELSPETLKQLEPTLEKTFGAVDLVSRNAIGPTLAKELLGNSLMALILAYLLITGYLTYRFQLDYAVCAIVALLHDTLFVLGVFSGLGYFFHTEVDSLFVTGILTVIGFSVHDTIVVFDRLRENTRVLYSQKLPFSEIVNISVNQTLARSINTSLVALLPLVALYFFGGASTKDLVLCMGVGILVGTYSSIFIASILLCLWRERQLGQSAPAVAGTQMA